MIAVVWLFGHDMVKGVPDPIAYTNYLAEYIASQRITIEVCLTSNAQTLPKMRDLIPKAELRKLERRFNVTAAARATADGQLRLA